MRNAFALGLFVLMTAPPAAALAQTEAPALAAQQRVRDERNVSIGFWAAGGILLTGGGLTTMSYVLPCVGSCDGQPVAFWTSVAAAGLGFISLVVALVLTTNAHRHWERLRDRGVSIGPGPGPLGFGIAVSF